MSVHQRGPECGAPPSARRAALRDILQLQPGATVGTWTATVPEDWAQGRTTFGGLVAALGARAMSARVPGVPLRSIYTQFVGPVAPGALEVQTHILRSGRSVLHAEARVFQSGVLTTILFGVFGESRPSEAVLAGAAPPALGDPAAIPRLPYIEGVTPRFTKNFEFRWPQARLPFVGASDDVTLGGFIRCESANEADEALLICLVDAWPAATLRMLNAPAPASSVTWKLDFAKGALAFEHSDFVRFESRTHMSADGYCTVEAEVWNVQGVLLARSSQLVAIFG
jgi:acyl-CoA thioesterase